jgi:hypothetical protein
MNESMDRFPVHFALPVSRIYPTLSGWSEKREEKSTGQNEEHFGPMNRNESSGRRRRETAGGEKQEGKSNRRGGCRIGDGGFRTQRVLRGYLERVQSRHRYMYTYGMTRHAAVLGRAIFINCARLLQFCPLTESTVPPTGPGPTCHRPMPSRRPSASMLPSKHASCPSHSHCYSPL